MRTVEQIKALIDSKERERNALGDEIEDLKHEQDNLSDEIEELERELAVGPENWAAQKAEEEAERIERNREFELFYKRYGVKRPQHINDYWTVKGAS